MITARQIIEIFFKGQKFGSRYVELFVNPTKSEMLEMTLDSFKKSSVREIRFVIDPEAKKFYACDGYVGLHPDMRRILNFTEDDIFIVYGNAFYNGQDFIVKVSDCASEVWRLQRPLEIKRFLNFDWGWVNGYVKGIDGYLKKFK